MAVQRFKLALNNARFPMVSIHAGRATSVPSIDTSARTPRQFQGADENIDFDVAQIIYGENFVPFAEGVKSVSYHTIIEPTVNTDFDQIFPLRDDEENTVLYSPSKGKNYRYDNIAELWDDDPMAAKWAAEVPARYISTSSEHTLATSKVTRAYVDGKTFVAYSRISLSDTNGGASEVDDGSIYQWNPTTQQLTRVDLGDAAAIIVNLPITIGEVDGISSSNGYLLVWSGLTIYWAPFNGTKFDFSAYASGEVTGAGSQIPEDIQGPITALIPVSGGFVIFTTKNAIAAFYNSNNFASPWIFKGISNAGGIETYEQAAVEGNLGSLYAYTTGGMQKITLNNADPDFPDVTDFLGGRFFETFNPSDKTFDQGQTTTEFFVKITYCGQRFVVISYGTFPGVYSYALVYDVGLRRWGKLRIVHSDCFSYSYGAEDADLTYSMLSDVSYAEMLAYTYGTAVIQGGALTYPRQAVAFLLKTGEVKLAVMDWRDPDDESEAFVVIGKCQLTRARLSTLQSLEVEGLRPGGDVAVWRSIDGHNLEEAEDATLREQNGLYSEWGTDLITGKNYTVYVNGDFALTSLVFEASNDGSL